MLLDVNDKEFKKICNKTGLSERTVLTHMNNWGCFEKHAISVNALCSWFLDLELGERVINSLGGTNYKITKKGRKWIIRRLIREELV